MLRFLFEVAGTLLIHRCVLLRSADPFQDVECRARHMSTLDCRLQRRFVHKPTS